jgi:copper chaperone CopZ
MSDNKTYQLKIADMDCADCAAKIEKYVRKLPGVKQAKIDFVNAKLNVEFQDAEINLDKIRDEIKKIGYSVAETTQIQNTTLIVAGMDCPDESRPIEFKAHYGSLVSNRYWKNTHNRNSSNLSGRNTKC